MRALVETEDGNWRGMRWNINGEEVWFLPESLAEAELTDIDNALTANGNVCLERHKDRFKDSPKYIPPENFDLLEFVQTRRQELGLPQY